MERNRIQEFLTELPSTDVRGAFRRADAPVAKPAPTFVAIPEVFWSGLGADERAQLALMYQRAFQLAEAQIQRECVDRLLESIAAQ